MFSGLGSEVSRSLSLACDRFAREVTQKQCACFRSLGSLHPMSRTFNKYKVNDMKVWSWACEAGPILSLSCHF